MEFRKHFIKSACRLHGFTLIEVLLTIALVSVLAAAGTYTLAQSREHAQISAAADTIAQMVRDAQSRSMAAQDGYAWGFRCAAGSAVLFSYTASIPETGSDTVELPSGFTCTIDRGELRFRKLDGVPSAETNIFLTMNEHMVRQFHISPIGSVSTVSL